PHLLRRDVDPSPGAGGIVPLLLGRHAEAVRAHQPHVLEHVLEVSVLADLGYLRDVPLVLVEPLDGDVAQALQLDADANVVLRRPAFLDPDPGLVGDVRHVGFSCVAGDSGRAGASGWPVAPAPPGGPAGSNPRRAGIAPSVTGKGSTAPGGFGVR